VNGMTPYGPSHPDYPNAPSDWDGGPYLCRNGDLYHMRGYGWAHGLGCWNPEADWDRVAYTAKGMEAAAAGETVPGSTEGDSPVPAGIRPETGLHIQHKRLPEGVR
jgi:hypothetical protein